MFSEPKIRSSAESGAATSLLLSQCSNHDTTYFCCVVAQTFGVNVVRGRASFFPSLSGVSRLWRSLVSDFAHRILDPSDVATTYSMLTSSNVLNVLN